MTTRSLSTVAAVGAVHPNMAEMDHGLRRDDDIGRVNFPCVAVR